MKLARGLLVMLLIMALAVSASGCFSSGPRPVPYDAYGKVTLDNSDGDGVNGVTIVVGGISTETNDDGEWSVTGVEGSQTVIPNRPGWEFNPPSATVSADSPEANFVGIPDTFTINVDIEPEGQGTVQLEPNKTEYIYQETVTLTAEATAAGWEFSHWGGDLGEYGDADVIEDFVMEQDINAVAYFLGPEQYMLTIVPDGEGDVAVDASSDPVAANTYREGTVVELTPQPERGWQFIGWGEDLSGDTSPAVVRINGNKTVKAVFERIPLTVYDDFEGDTLDTSLWTRTGREDAIVALEGGKLRLETPSGGTAIVTLTSTMFLSGEYFAVSAQLDSITGSRAHFGVQAGSYSIGVDVAQGGTVRLYKDGSSVTMPGYTIPDPKVVPTEPNELVIRREGDTFYLIVNGSELHSETIAGFPTEDVTFFMRAWTNSAVAVAIWDEVSYGQF